MEMTASWARMEGALAPLNLTPEEASKLLCLCMVSPGHLDAQAESALRKLAQFIRDQDKTTRVAAGAAPSWPARG